MKRTLLYQSKHLLAIISLLFITLDVNAQLFDFLTQTASEIEYANKYSRSALRSNITRSNQCSTGTLSFEYGAVAIFESNGYYCTPTVSRTLSSKLKEINKAAGVINDVHIAENGKFIIIYDNGKSWYGVIPESVNSALNSISSSTEIRSVTFNEKGEYAITTSWNFKSNNALYQAFYDDHIGEYRNLMSVTICGDGAVFCYSNGCYYVGKIPKSVETAIREFSSTPKFVKFNVHGDYLICDADGNYSYLLPDVTSSRTSTMVTYDYAKERAKRMDSETIARMEKSATYKYIDSLGLHMVSSGEMFDLGGTRILLETFIGAQKDQVPGLNIIAGWTFFNDNLEELRKSMPSSGELDNMIMEITLSNGEIITSNSTSIGKTALGFQIVTNLFFMRSNKKSLSGTDSDIRYLIERLSHNNIMSIRIKGRYTIDLSGKNTQDQLLYDFHRLCNESGRVSLLPK